ncbi:MAG: glycoside hydrolase family 127 protein [Phycisphaerae bacterium]|nr:glycoside hydrolase family 127 protein [Phycisphaerae bacterium]
MKLTRIMAFAAPLLITSSLIGEPVLRVPLQAEPFALSQVRLLDGPFKANEARDRQYLHDLDADRLLHTFRLNAGLASSARPLGGWEKPDCELRGHTMGHFLSACAFMVAATGDEALKTKAERIVAELAKCQKAIGDSGYLSAFPETWFDRVEAFKPVWAPYYTLHKIYAGLMDMYQYCGNQQALAVAEKMAAWNQSRLGKLDEAHMQEMLNKTEQGGMNDAFANLYALTGKSDYLTTAGRFNQRTYVEPLLQGKDTMTGQHVNSFIPNIIGSARQYEVTGDIDHRHVAEYFWDQVVNHRSYCTGGNSNREHFQTDPDHLADQLGDNTQETCCTYNMLKLTKHLFTWSPEARYGDYYERALINSILSTQNPRDGMMMYFVPLATGRHKMYNLPNDSFWCCTGSGLENHGRYGEAVYFHKADTLYVNLFMATELNWQDKGVRLRQDTAFPDADTTVLTVKTDAPTRIDLRVRVPYWAVNGVFAKLNGKEITLEPTADHYAVIDRVWQDNDRLEMRMPMGLHRHAMPDDPTLMAFMFGPLVLAGQLGGDGLTDENTHTTQNWYKYPEPMPTVPPMTVTSDNIDDWLAPVPGKPMTFRTTCLETPIELVPYHRLFDQRYCVYWSVVK